MTPDSNVSDAGSLGYSLANVRELLTALLDAASARSVAEVGAYRGELTAVLLDWAGGAAATVAAVEPEPPAELRALAEARPELELIEATSHDALASQPLPDAVVIDGDHNWFTLSEELRLIGERASDGVIPLVLLHDMCWPHARRDTYYAPDRIPEEHRQPLAHDVTVRPGEPGLATHGLPYRWAAVREGGERNGTLTAAEDFAAAREAVRLAVVPAFFGFGVLWSERAPWADEVAALVAPWDRNPILERLEANRVEHLVRGLEAEGLRAQNESQAEVLRALLGSRAFALAERLSRLRQRGDVTFSRARIRRALGLPDA